MNKTCCNGAMVALDPEMKVFELIDAYPELLSIFSRLGITLPFGDISVEQMCRRDGYSSKLFMLICRMHIDLSYIPTSEHISEDMLGPVIGYLRATHRYYMEYMLPHTGRHLNDILEHCDELLRSMLSRFYADYVACIEEHLGDEEQRLFSNVERSETSADMCNYELDQPHSDIDDRTGDIASLIVKCLPEEAPTTLRCTMLAHIYMLRDDLRRHHNIERYLLRPLVEKFVNK